MNAAPTLVSGPPRSALCALELAFRFARDEASTTR
jgi:hypothetical protein